MTTTRVLITDLAGQPPGPAPNHCEPDASVGRGRLPTVRSAPAVRKPDVHSARGGWDARITTGEQRRPGTVIDCAQFGSMDEAKQWTAAAVLYWQAHAPDGWWVTGGITARADPQRAG
jgi:hypothetical protein